MRNQEEQSVEDIEKSVDALSQPLVVGKGCSLALGISLACVVIVTIIAVAPASPIQVVHSCLAGEPIISYAGGIVDHPPQWALHSNLQENPDMMAIAP